MAKGRQTHRSTGGKRKRPAPPAVATNAAPQAPAASRPAAPVAVRYGTTSARASAAPAKAVDFSTEYHYVLGDLKRIGILAAASFTVLVALALLIR